MDNTYQILLIEDNQQDVELIELELSKLDKSISIISIGSREELKTHLASTAPDLIISDYNMPGFTGIEALKIVRDRSDIPFILVSGHIGEEKAVDAMLQGASDYVMKENMDRLKPAVIRELSNYQEQKRKQRQLDQTQSRYQILLQSVNGIVWEANADTFEFSYVSPQSEEILGYSPDEWLDIPNFWQDHIHPKDREKAISYCHNQTELGKDHSFEYRMIAANDDVVWLRDYVTVVPMDGEPNRLRGLMINITSEKIAEQQRDKAYQVADIGHWELDLVHDQLYWSDTIKKLHEVELDYSPDLDSAISFYKEGKDRKKITEAVEKTIQTGEPFHVELKIVTAKGHERWVRAVGEAEFTHGKCVRLYGSTQNITERKNYEEKLKQTEQRLREIVENSTNMFYRHDTNHLLTYLSPQCEEFLGYSIEEAKRRWTEFATDHPVNEKGLAYTQKAIATGHTQPSFELQLQKKDGDIIWVLVNEAPIVEDGKTVAIVGSLTDITEQKEYEDKLEQLSLVASKTTDMIIITDAHEHITWVNHAFEEQTGYRLAEVQGKIPGELLQGPETNPQTRKRIAQKLDNLETVQEVILNYAKNGQRYWLDVTIDPILNADGECTGFIAIERDVTDEIERSRKLQEIVDRYEIVSKATSDTIWELDLKTNTIQYNQNIYSMFGYQKEEVEELSEWWQNKIHPADRQYVLHTLDGALDSNEDRIQFEYRFKCADDSYKFIYDRAFVVRNSNGEPIRIIGAMQDISTFKEREHRNRKFQEVVSGLATDRSLLQMDILDALSEVLKTSAKTLDVERVNIWLLEDNNLRCISSYDQGNINVLRGETLARKQYPTYFRYINEQRIIAAENPHTHEAFNELADYVSSNNIQSVLDISVLSYGSTQAVVSYETIDNTRDWESDEISFAGAITDQIAQLLAYQEKKERDKEIRESLKEKETLLAEVHHRVKNNLAVVSGMMQLQAYEEDDEDLKHKLFDSVARIQTMAAIHELLYQSNSFSNLQLDENIKRLINNISDTFQSKANIQLHFELEPVRLNVNQAIPCSLIVNEVITNALKHAFNDQIQGTITINLSQNDQHQISLIIKDDGSGLPDNLNSLSQNGSLGFKLIDTLAKQLEANYEFSSDKQGTVFTLTFEKAQVKGIGSALINE